MKRAFAKEKQRANSTILLFITLSALSGTDDYPDGGEFHDQAIALAKLRVGAKDVQIIVKEHPTQFYRIEGHKRACPIFYNLPNNIEGITLVGDIDLELIRRSVFVSSISGTVGFNQLSWEKRR